MIKAKLNPSSTTMCEYEETSGKYTSVDEGWVIIPAKQERVFRQYAPFVTVTEDEFGNISVADNPDAREAYIDPTPDPDPEPSLEEQVAELTKLVNILAGGE